MQMEMFTKASGKMTKHRAKVYTLTETVLNMKECGKVINNTALEKKYGQMELNTKEITFKVKNMGLANSNGLTVQYMKEISSITIFTDKEHIDGAMVDSMKASGDKIECIIVEYSNGQMEGNILVSM